MFKLPDTGVAVVAKKSSDDTGVVAVVDVKALCASVSCQQGT